MIQTNKGLRLNIGIYGRRNAGKSSLLNLLTRQETAIVSDTPGTTTDPVEKNMELLPIGPVTLIDTAGLDDVGTLGNQRVERSLQTMQRADVALLVTDGLWTESEARILDQLTALKTPVVLVCSKCDTGVAPSEALRAIAEEHHLPCVPVSALHKTGIQELVDSLVAVTPDSFWAQRPIVSDILPAHATVILVIPIDKEAPRGRLILPQVQTLRDLLDGGHHAFLVQDNELPSALAQLKQRPDLVICDSQVFHKIKDIVPMDVPLTSFSVLFARFKGDLNTLIAGTRAIADLRDGDKVLIAEACSHHPIGEDIGTVKIPAALQKKTGAALVFEHAQGHDMPKNLADYKLIIHCGGCTFNPKEVMSRIACAVQAQVPISNYGLTLAYCTGIFERAIAPFSGDAPEEV